VRKIPLLRSTSLASDALIFFLIGTLIYGVTIFGRQWHSGYNPTFEIDLSPSALPVYAMFSTLRSLVAYFISLAFTLVVGYWAAKSPRAEKIILPFLDVMQSIPVLGFLPGLVLGLVAIFPHTNTGLELAAILMIFTGQVWNMAFAFYASLKSVPMDLREAASVMRLAPMQKLKLLELPFAAVNLTWNSVMSMAGGWFFLTVCEAFTLGEKQYRLPGLGAYMAVAIDAGNTRAVILGILAMALVIVLLDILIWRPALVWVHRYRLEESDDNEVEEPLIQFIIKDSVIIKIFKAFYFRPRQRKALVVEHDEHVRRPFFKRQLNFQMTDKQANYFTYTLLSAFAALSLYAFYQLVLILTEVKADDWAEIFINTGLTFLRVFAAIFIGTLWATPVGIWLSQSNKRLRIAQPIIQLMASFPAPMLYPLAIAVFLFLNINFEVSAMLLMLLGVQWYILFNVLAGGLRVPTELKLAMQLMKSPMKDRWRFLFLPSVFPALVTGWITAAGGAWNASIVSELVPYKGTTLTAHGLGASISLAAAHGNFPKLAACLLVMVVVVVLLNRTVWSKIYAIAQTRYRLDL
jgi:NitT/TauT family transport system permease protein